MAKKTLPRRGTALPDSDVQELVTQWNAGQYWVLNAAIALSGTTYSASMMTILATNGTARHYTLSTGAGFTGITVATGNYAVCVAYITQAGTHVVAGTGASATGNWNGAGIPTIPSTAFAYGAVLIRCSGTSGFTGGTTALDGTNASAIFINLNGPAGMAFSTAAISVVPG